jgi:hypothetical protein
LASFKYFFPQWQLFHLIFPHRPASWAGSVAEKFEYCGTDIAMLPVSKGWILTLFEIC